MKKNFTSQYIGALGDMWTQTMPAKYPPQHNRPTRGYFNLSVISMSWSESSFCFECLGVQTSFFFFSLLVSTHIGCSGHQMVWPHCCFCEKVQAGHHLWWRKKVSKCSLSWSDLTLGHNLWMFLAGCENIELRESLKESESKWWFDLFLFHSPHSDLPEVFLFLSMPSLISTSTSWALVSGCSALIWSPCCWPSEMLHIVHNLCLAHP